MASVLEDRRSMREVPQRVARREFSSRGREARQLGRALAALQVAGWTWASLNQRSLRRTRAGSALGTLAGDLGRGLVAGAVGTLVITLAAAIDQQVRHRRQPASEDAAAPPDLFQILIGPWVYSADAVSKVLGGLTPANDRAKRRLALAAHLGYGSSWGMSLVALDRAGARGPAAIGALLGGVLGAEMLLMPRAGFFPPVGEWGSEAIISSTYQHALYAIAAGLTYDLLQP